MKRRRVRKRYERFDEDFAKALDDPEFCEEFKNLIKHIQQKPALKSDISIQQPKSIPKIEFKKPLQPAQSRLQMMRAKKKLTVRIP